MKTIRTLLRVIAFGPLMMGISIMAYVFFFNLPFLSAILTGYLFDALSGRAPLGANVWTMLALVAASDGARIASQLGFIRNWARFIATVEAHLKSNMLRGALSARPDRLTLSPGEAVTRFGDDVDKLTRTLDDWCDNIGILVYIVVSSLVLFRIEPRMTLILFSLGLLLVVVSQPLYHRVERLYRDARAAAERVAGFTGEVMGGVQAIKTGTAELRVRARFTALGELRRRAELRSVMLQLVADTFIASTVTSLGTGILLFIAARSIRGGALTVGEFTLFVTTAPRLTEYLRRIGQGLVLVWQSGISLDRMAELNAGGEAELLRRNPVFLRGELPPAAPPELQAPLATLTVAGLSYTYPDGRRGIEAVDLTISRGELVVITGRVGSGKMIRVPSSGRRTRLTALSRRACSAAACATTSCSAWPAIRWRWPTRSAMPRLMATLPRCQRASRPSSDPRAPDCQAVRSSASRLPGCSFGDRNCSSLTIWRAPSMSRPSGQSGIACSAAPKRLASRCRIAGPSSPGLTGSSS